MQVLGSKVQAFSVIGSHGVHRLPSQEGATTRGALHPGSIDKHRPDVSALTGGVRQKVAGRLGLRVGVRSIMSVDLVSFEKTLAENAARAKLLDCFCASGYYSHA